jgi:ATP-dependent helicase/nuclease subunit A
VAATRARDLLVVPTIGDHPFGNWDSIENWWLRPLYKAIYPPEDRYRKPEEACACPKFGTDSVLTRPNNAFADDDNVCPGRYIFTSNATGYDVTWWDPQMLKLGVRQSFGIRQEELLAVADPETLKSDLEAYQHWRRQVADVLDHGAKPSVVVRTATNQARIASGDRLPTVTLVELPRNKERPAGVRFGALVHATLSTVDLDAAPESTKRVATLQGRILGASEEEVEAASITVQTVLGHPLLQRAGRAWLCGQCRRETPITLTLENGTLVEGVIDVAFLEDDSWTVIDFKTDRELEKELEHYERQVGIYALAISRATGKSTLPVLVSV